ncbi:histidinol-phosphatase [Chloroflexus sp.]|uniref:histidinol-phosphatase n=1 Tax=Chloroflexus sp. TaxID=1904827 RepID=UPI00262891A9|nr:histidinol-phosphatase [uncultured Chloroflexus sp.]
MTASLERMLTFARQIAAEAGQITLRYFQQGVTVEHKADESPVTIADREAERYLRAAIAAAYPDHAILGEEDGLTGSEQATYRWVLDPIDGTKSFVRGVPLYGVLIGLLREGEPVLGVIYIPALNEMVAAAQGLGCAWNGQPCRVSTVSSLSESLVVGTIAHGYEQYGRAAAFQRILSRARLFRTWGDCYGYVLVATGRAEVALDPAMNVWDAAALLPILTEAGGTYTDWKGQSTIYNGEGIGSNRHVLPELLAVIASEE